MMSLAGLSLRKGWKRNGKMKRRRKRNGKIKRRRKRKTE